MISKEDIHAVISHMNEDHSDAVLEYALVYANRRDATSARMINMASDYMDLDIQSDAATETIRVFFDEPVNDRTESRIKLVALLKLARSGEPPELKIETLSPG